MTLQAPFPWFGGKRTIALEVWQRLGDPISYVEPFFGSGAVLLNRGVVGAVETVNDADGLLANFWRSVQNAPAEVARHADWPVNECDLHARHLWLVGQREVLTERLMADPDFCDPKAAGWWCWGASAWIGSGWCSGIGPWIVDGGRLVNARKMPHVGDAGQGINRKMPHVGDAGRGINRQMPHVGDAGRGINRKMPHVGDAGRGINRQMQALSDRLRRVRVVCGDWTRVMGDSVLWPTRSGICGVFIDPPYRSDHAISYSAGAQMDHAALEAWCLDNGQRQNLRIVLCGYEGEYQLPGWSQRRWKTRGGYGSQGSRRGRENAQKETIWFSPNCHFTELPLFGEVMQ